MTTLFWLVFGVVVIVFVTEWMHRAYKRDPRAFGDGLADGLEHLNDHGWEFHDIDDDSHDD